MVGLHGLALRIWSPKATLGEVVEKVADEVEDGRHASESELWQLNRSSGYSPHLHLAPSPYSSFML